MRHNQKRSIPSLLRAAALTALVLALVCFVLLAVSKVREAGEKRAEDRLRDLYEGAVSENAGFSLINGAAEESVAESFSELYAINPELVGWIRAGSDISDPVVRRDNEYYLNHDFYGDSSVSGTVFADEENRDWVSDPYVLLYGHNMKNDTMFGMMDHYLLKSYLAENARVRFHWICEDEPREYVPFAMLDISADPESGDYFHLRRYDLFDPERQADPEQFRADVLSFVNEIREKAQWQIPEIPVDETDAILGLVTCGYGREDGRLVLFCRALRDGETPEQMAETVRQSVAP